MASHMNREVSDSQSAAGTAGARRSSGLDLMCARRERILVINCGSSSLKYAYFDTADPSRLSRGEVERIGIPGTLLTHRGGLGRVERGLPAGGYPEAFQAMTAELTGNSGGSLEVSIVVHRVVHGGERFTGGTLITDKVLREIDSLSSLALLHNPVNVAGIRAMRGLFPAARHVAVFDTAFHHTLPARAFLYGLPYELSERHHIRRYGFHGTSHQYAGLRTAEFLERRPDELRVVSCHLGNGASLCAIDRGRSIDTTMGFTPAEGLIMGTRCGDVDAGVIAFLERTEGWSATETEVMLNKKSGLLGLSGISSDMREIQKGAAEGNVRAATALEAYSYRVRRSIGGYAAVMGGLDAVVFTGGVGQGSAAVRTLALEGLDCLGILLDESRNRSARGFEEICRISSDESKVPVLIVPADEERMMAREALLAVGEG